MHQKYTSLNVLVLIQKWNMVRFLSSTNHLNLLSNIADDF